MKNVIPTSYIKELILELVLRTNKFVGNRTKYRSRLSTPTSTVTGPTCKISPSEVNSSPSHPLIPLVKICSANSFCFLRLVHRSCLI